MKKMILFLMLILITRFVSGQNLQKTIDSLTQLLSIQKEDTSKVNVLNSLSDKLWQVAQFNKSLDYANNALVLAQKLNFKKGIAKAYYNRGYVYWNQGKYPEGLSSHFASLKIGEEINDKGIVVNAYGNIGNIYYKQGNYAEAMKMYLLELKMREEMKDKQGMAYSYRHLANVSSTQGNYPDAVKNYLASLKIDEELNNKLGICYTYCNIGNVYEQQGNYPEALKNYFASLTIANEINNKQTIAVDYLNIGDVYARQNNYSEALKNSIASLKITNEIGDRHSIAAAYNSIGYDYFKLTNYPEAIKNELTAIKLAEEIGDKSLIASSYIYAGKIYFKLQKTFLAKEFLDKAMLLATEIGSKNDIMDSYSALSELDSAMGNLAEAYKYMHLYTIIKDSLLNETSNKQISQLKIQYETEKKDREIKTQGLQLKNQTLQNRILQISIVISLMVIGIIVLIFYLSSQRNRRKKKEYEHMLIDLELNVLKSQLNPHFISNSLSAINNFIDQQPEEASQFLVKFARLMRRVLEQNEMPLISLKEELETIELYMQIESLRLRYGFDYRFNYDSLLETELIMVPPLILQPTIENALWHGLAAKSEKGHIIINIKMENGLLKFTIEDNGTGKDTRVYKSSISITKKKSFGVSITRKRIEILSKELKKDGYYNLTFLDGRTVTEIGLPVNYN